MREKMKSLDHVAIVVKDPKAAVKWYCDQFGGRKIYVDDTWGMVQFSNIKLAFVVEEEHPAHIAFNAKVVEGTRHRDGSVSKYTKDPWGNDIELIDYFNAI
jgi:catechol 2,3-dioxygenase-like lactoylglutathione lyase family enzyme